MGGDQRREPRLELVLEIGDGGGGGTGGGGDTADQWGWTPRLGLCRRQRLTSIAPKTVATPCINKKN